MGYRYNHRSRWSDVIEPDERAMVERIAFKYDAALRAGRASQDTFWKDPYCEGIIDGVLMASDTLDEFTFRMCIAEFCVEHGYMIDPKRRPEWMGECMAKVKERWDADDAAHMCGRGDVGGSRAKLRQTFARRGWTVKCGPKPKTMWVLSDENGKFIGNIMVRAYNDGREATYKICNEKWNVII